MRRKLLAGGTRVKQAPILALLALVAAACGGAPPVQRRVDPYGARVSGCIDVPRPLAEGAQLHMIAMPGAPAVLGSTAQERAQARIDFGRGADPRLFEDEPLQRRAYVHGFRMDKSPITNEQFAEFTAACGVLPPDAEAITEARYAALQQRFGQQLSYAQVLPFLWGEAGPRPERARHPVVLVSHDDAGFYCAWRGARLPTAEEWERAARGPNGSIYPWGNRYDLFRVNTAQRGEGGTLNVGALPQGNTAEGFTDMGGHVFEWTDSPVPGRAAERIVKGNGWLGRGGYGRGAARVTRHVEQKAADLGFRCAADL